MQVSTPTTLEKIPDVTSSSDLVCRWSLWRSPPLTIPEVVELAQLFLASLARERISSLWRGSCFVLNHNFLLRQLKTTLNKTLANTPHSHSASLIKTPYTPLKLCALPHYPDESPQRHEWVLFSADKSKLKRVCGIVLMFRRSWLDWIESCLLFLAWLLAEWMGRSLNLKNSWFQCEIQLRWGMFIRVSF